MNIPGLNLYAARIARRFAVLALLVIGPGAVGQDPSAPAPAEPPAATPPPPSESAQGAAEARRLLNQAMEFAAEGRYEDALQTFELVKDEAPNAVEAIDALKIAVVRAEVGDAERHLAHSRWLAERHRDADTPSDAERSVKGYIVFHGAKDPELIAHAVARTRHAVDKAEEHGQGPYIAWFHAAHGIALYRAGEHDEAARFLAKSIDDESVYIRGLALPFLAMAEHARGDADRARELLERTRALAGELPEPGSPEYLVEWTDTLVANMGRAEAERVIGG